MDLHCLLELLHNAFSEVDAGVLTLQGIAANITSRNIALKRCMSAEMVVSKQRFLHLCLLSLPLLGRFLQTRTDSFNDVSAVRHQPHHQDARSEATSRDSSVDHRLCDKERKRKSPVPLLHTLQRLSVPCSGPGEYVRTSGAEERRRGWKVTAALARCKR